MLVTAKQWLKSALNYRSYPQNKTGYRFFWTTLYTSSWTLSSESLFLDLYYTLAVISAILNLIPVLLTITVYLHWFTVLVIG